MKKGDLLIQVKIIPTVTRWISSNGVDVIQLKAGEGVAVPKNVADHLCAAGQAELVA